MKKHIPALSCALLLALGLTGCGSDPEEAPAVSSLASKYVYSAAYTPLRLNGLTYACVSGNTLYCVSENLAGAKVVETDFGSPSLSAAGDSLFAVNPETQEKTDISAAQLAERKKDADGGALEFYSVIPGADETVWALQRLYTYTSDNGELSGETGVPELCRYDAGGTLLQAIPVDGLDAETFYSLQTDGQGNFYCMDYKQIHVIGPDGTLRWSLPAGGVYELSKNGDSQVGVVAANEAGQTVFRPIDPDAGAYGSELPLDNAARIYPGSGDYTCFFDRNGDVLYGVRSDTGETERLLSWLDYDVDCTALCCFTVEADGTVTAVSREGPELVVLRRANPEDLPEKTELTLACLYQDDYLVREIRKFNRAHPEVHITVRNYAEAGDYDAGEALLQTEILAGAVPDLFYMDNMRLQFYAADGYLTDLWPMIDGDEELRREDLMTHVLDVLSLDGMLCCVSSSFSISTTAVPAALLPDQTQWTLAEVKDARQRAGDCSYVFGAGDSQAGLLFRLVGHNSGDFLDLKEGVCRFDSPEFLEILEFAKAFPAELETNVKDFYTYEANRDRVLEGEQLCAELEIGSFSQFQRALLDFGEDVRLVGFPSRTGGSLFRCLDGLAISSACDAPELAWSFARTVLTERYQAENPWIYFPTNRHVFEAQAQEAMEKPDKISCDSYGNKLNLPCMTQAAYDRFLSLYESCNRTIGYNDAVMSIVLDEADYYFSGLKSAEETARIIQDRVSLYLAERKVS